MPDEDLWFRRANLIDVAVNITGFVPFGLFLAAWLMAGKDLAAVHACAVTALLGFCLSLAIELTQAYIPGRDSSLLDVVSNTVGTAIGVFLLNYAPLVLPSTGSASGQQERGKTYRSS